MSEVSLNSDDVISMPSEKGFTKGTTAKVSEIKLALKDRVSSEQLKWFSDGGVECEVLIAQTGGGWRKGKIQFCLKFVPDKAEQLPEVQPSSLAIIHNGEQGLVTVNKFLL
ncbi:KGK domain-containing protein [Scytonema sp. UIC 10036]|uniref:KGK domain-containing protein n=1 Tax=Scytonema sp. UIC 10036 TaxID=2304196 RepID=UPI00140FAA69